MKNKSNVSTKAATLEQRFEDALKKRIDWQRENTNDPYGISTAVYAALLDVHASWQEARLAKKAKPPARRLSRSPK